MKYLTAHLILPVLALALMSGCHDRAASVAMEAAERQAAQNLAIVEANKEVADGTRRLIATDAESRRQIVLLHRELQAERARLSSQWDELDIERQRVARVHGQASLYVPVAEALGGFVLVVTLVGFCWFALVRVRDKDSDALLEDLLIREIVSDEPRLLLGVMPRPRPAKWLDRQRS